MTNRPALSAIVLTGCWLFPTPLTANCDCAPMGFSGLQFSCFSITVSGTSSQRADVSEGIGEWQSDCNSGGLGLTIPRMQMYDATNNPNPCSGYPTEQVFNVQISFMANQPTGNPPECGFAIIDFAAGDGEIQIYNQANDGGSCNQRQEDIIAHELGHFLGFDDIPGNCQLACSGRVMSGDIYQSGTVVDRNIITEDCGRADEMNSPSRPPRPGGGGVPPPCSGTILSDSTFLPIAGAAPAAANSRQPSLFTGRFESVEGFTYIMEDWAVVSFGHSAQGQPLAMRIERSSSPSFALSQGTTVSDQEIAGVGLLIEAPAHLHNSRHIPTPEVRLQPTAIPYLGERVTAALRIDLGENRRVRDVQILHTTGAIPHGIDLTEHINSNFEVLYASNQQHRVIVFAVVDLADGRILLRQSQAILPRCCCNPICT